jgi:hypothetical protein
MSSWEFPSQKIEKKEPLETGAKTYDFLNKTGFLEMRKSDEQFETWLQNLSYDEYKEYLTRINGVLRKTPIYQRKIDGQGVGVSFGIMHDTEYIPPLDEEKDGLMQEGFNAFKEIKDNEDRALLEYYLIQAIHPFEDGNGRTGRLMHDILSERGKTLTKEQLSELLDHDDHGAGGTGEGRSEFAKRVLAPEKAYTQINREVAKELFGDEILSEYGSIFLSGATGVGWIPDTVDVSPEEKQRVEAILGESGGTLHFPFRSLVVLKLLQENGTLDKYKYIVRHILNEQDTIPEDVGKQMLGIDNEEVMNRLTKEDVNRLLEIHQEVKELFIRTMIDFFVHPEVHQMKNKLGEEDPIKNSFRATRETE